MKSEITPQCVRGRFHQRPPQTQFRFRVIRHQPRHQHGAAVVKADQATAAARRAHQTGCSLRDVQLLAGHRSIEVTQGYIEGDSRAQRRLVALI